MRYRLFTIPALVLTAVVGLSSCSVKDERGGMPSYLRIIFKDGPDGSPAKSDIYAMNTLSTGFDTFRWGRDLSPDSKPDGLLLCVPRGYTRVGAYSGLDSGDSDEGTIFWENGVESDSLWAHTSVADCRRELARDTVLLHKQWCTLSVIAVNQRGDEGYNFRVEAPYAGMDVLTTEPVKEQWPYSSLMRLPEGNRYEVRIPRQKADDKAAMRLFLRIPSGEEVENYPLGDVLEKAGYDWTEEDLKDITLKIDFVRLVITAVVIDWKEAINIEINL